MREITLSQAVNEALAEEMRRDPTVFILGEDVAEAGTPFKVLSAVLSRNSARTASSTRRSPSRASWAWRWARP
jgi:pyruvate/2-oxoglutarate/acetoin dehydrogenase E1 component